MKPEFWLGRWQTGRTGFHQSEAEPLLLENFPKAGAHGKVFVPLCGKSLDMVWLARQGYEVVGVELSPLACEGFFGQSAWSGSPAPAARGFHGLECGTLYDPLRRLLQIGVSPA